MKALYTILVLVALISIGCAGPYRSGKVNITKTPGEYTLSGHSYDTIEAIEATSRSTINERLADACIEGNANACYSFLNAYYGYAYGGMAESSFYGYYGPGGMIPTPGALPTDSGAAARAEKKADAAVSAVKAILEKLEAEEGK